ncbi:pSer/pThr/pTyr-binding forkhead associated (FHA) protein [Kitasatospora sp. GP30]|uniref:rodlet layer protein n=1 Tax=Kitasatospora sp. GP30 TaxID=3035084 RepID=UPI000C701DEA|nr:rodlet layer protein [Kitasatospora sp. GP30]MDH6138660.1 pSer/pThr/pTyr-binding forkhead associated (FHA) protein [Kitasatospora sp. GP30]
MIKKTLAVAGLAAAALGAAVSPASAIANADGSAASLQGNGGTNNTGTYGDHSPNFHFLDNANVCLPQIDHVQVGLLDVNAEVPIGNQQPHQICNVGQTTQTTGDGVASHLIG